MANINKTTAISKARRDVTVCRFGRDYVVHTWDDSANATRISHPMSYRSAMQSAAAAKLTAALVYMGWHREDAGHIAYNMEPGTRWESMARIDE